MTKPAKPFAVILTTPSGRVERAEYKTIRPALKYLRSWFGQLGYRVAMETWQDGVWVDTPHDMEIGAY